MAGSCHIAKSFICLVWRGLQRAESAQISTFTWAFLPDRDETRK